ncbi:thioredoxin [Streptomyces sp. NPDC050264]|uniref:thioredoxin n=1 Tax=Streptomyces sp. NPDC050264 TaxID=3155038 RepID=UPI0034269074
MANVRELTDDDFDEIVLGAGRAVLVDFWAPWCGPCRGVAPVMEAMADDHHDRIDVGKANLEHVPRAAERYGVTSLPALLMFQDGKVVATLVGAKPRSLVEKAFAAYL